ncbi:MULTISPECIES: acetate--CoA ligase family protein [Bordetella]|uniref:Acyl-CoA synthetase n=1 Tax=Bordetella genomosp. 6 TaxID=463024 RepID=A0ABX4F9I7_9BORD|nr:MULTISPECIES: acetate--CoA ligase family protein [Bordetella]AWP73990.1 acyl-CoA synthetase [Bordetella bronchiseptica]AZW43005.1 CoA-binding protein [Bordetella bronchiseptica]KCV62460.1 ATP-grasp domain protein [Bordetella bronchiseptica 99-R-0433]KDB66621.1 ATP-grasp domain protein [Bordetella bronchiseptica A1-7]KDB67915.1 ATP-grasp domain protein [Bordetella bronchiseptica B20-10725633]
MFQNLAPLFAPESLVLIGASDRPASIGQRTLVNIVEHSRFDGELFLVNATKDEVMGRRAYRSVLDLPYAPQTAIVVVPAKAAVEVLAECGRKGVRFAIVLSSGFGETGEAGRQLEEQMRAIVRETGLRIYGPNCPGMTNNNRGLGFTFSPAYQYDRMAGPIGLVTQGGGLGRTFLQACGRGVGIGLWCSSGNEADLTASDYINHMVEMPEIKVIVALLEGINDPPRFARAALNAARQGKPIVALKVGKSAYGVQATQSHTAALSGSAEVNSAAFRQLGIVEVDDIDELIDTAALLARGAPARPIRAAVYSFSGGTVALAADMLGSAGLELSRFEPATRQALAGMLPSYAAIDNPVDTTAEILVQSDISYGSLLCVARDPNVDVVLYPIPMEYGDTTLAACRNMVKAQAEVAVPIVPVWMSDKLGAGFQCLVDAGLTPVRTLGKSVKALAHWNRYGQWMRRFERDWEPSVVKTAAADAAARSEPRAYAEREAKQMLADAGVAVPFGQVCRSADEAVRAAAQCQGPVVAKIVSAQILHKSDIGGVAVGLRTPQQVRDAWETIDANARAACPDARIDGILIEQMIGGPGVETLVGVHEDPLFGHVMTFGLGGVYVEVFKDVSRRLLPLTPQDARDMIRETRCHQLLQGCRGQAAADIEALERLLLAVSGFVVDGPWHIKELDLNPVLAGPAGATALDAVLIGAPR